MAISSKIQLNEGTLEHTDDLIIILKYSSTYCLFDCDSNNIMEGSCEKQKNGMIKMYPKLNHFYSEGTGPSEAKEYFVTGNVPKYVIDDLSDWIKENHL